MNYSQKKSLKLPIFLIIGPAVVTFLAVFLQGIVRPEASSPSGDTYVDYMNSIHDAYVFDNLPILEKLPTLALGLIGIFGLLAIVPCFIFGVVMLFKRRPTG